MPLPDPAAREELHVRRIDCRCFKRADGLFDVEAHLVDTRSFDLPHRSGAGKVAAFEPIHDMWIRLTIDVEMEVKAVAASTDASPYAYCGGATEPMQGLVGLRIGAGWARRTRELLGNTRGCTHLMELLGPLATTAYQGLVAERWKRPERLGSDGRPAQLDSCYAYASHRPAVKRLWPQYYTGPAEEESI